MFKSSHLRPLPSDLDEPRSDGKTMRQRLRVVQYWDLAFSEKASADYTAASTVGVDGSQNLYLLNVYRERIDEARLDEAMAAHIARTSPQLVGVEEGAYKQAATQDLIRRLYCVLQVKYQKAVAVRPIKVTVDKVFRAQLPAGRAQAGTFYADRLAPWWPAFETEALRFPKGAHDDQVDSLSGATQLAIEATPPEREKQIPYTITSAMKPKDARHWSETAPSAFVERGVSPLRGPVR